MIQGQTIVMRALTPDRSDMLNAALKMQHQNPKFILPELQVWDPGGQHWNLSKCRNRQLTLMKKLRYEWTIITDCDGSILNFNPELLSEFKINRAWTDTYHGFQTYTSWWAIHDNILDLFPGIPRFDETLTGSFWQDVDWMLKCEGIGLEHNNSDPEAFKIYHHPHEHNDPDPESSNRNREIMNKRYPNRTF